MVELINGDCMDYMRGLPDKCFDLAIVDPPYGIQRGGQKATECKNRKHNRKSFEIKSWDDKIPDKKYFDELFRVSKNQIIWGANYFTQYLPSSMGWVFWDKGQDLSMSDGELAYTSFNKALRRKIINRVELLKEGTIHPTQKPVKLYEWLLTNYAQKGDKILDTHGGSMSIAIAVHKANQIDKMNLNLTLIELDEEYFKKGLERFNNFRNQQFLF